MLCIDMLRHRQHFESCETLSRQLNVVVNVFICFTWNDDAAKGCLSNCNKFTEEDGYQVNVIWCRTCYKYNLDASTLS